MYLAALREDVSSGANKVSGVETRLELSGDKLTHGCQPVSVFYTAHRIIL